MTRKRRVRPQPPQSPSTETSSSGGRTAGFALALQRSWEAGKIATLSRTAALLVPGLAFLLLFPLVRAMPGWDQWSLIPLWRAHFEGGRVLPLLLEPYNGHLNVVPRWVFYALGVMSDWNVRLEVVASFAAAAVTLWLLCRMLERHGRGAGMLALPCAVQVFSFVQFENFLSGYPLGQNLEQLAATSTIFLLTLPTLRWRTTMGAMIGALAATFSWGAGLAVWPIGLLALAGRPDRSRLKIAVWTGATVVSAWLVRSSARGRFPPVPWPEAPAFYLALLGKPWAISPLPTARHATIFGAVALTAFVVLSVVGTLRLGAAARQWILAGTMSLAAAGLITVGRAGSGIQHGLASHYATATYPLLVSVLVLTYLIARDLADARPRWRSIALFAAGAVAVTVTAQAVYVSLRTYPIVSGWSASSRGFELALARGTATDQQIRGASHPNVQLVRTGVELLRVNGLAWFRGLADDQPPGGGVLTIDGRAASAYDSPPAIGPRPWTVSGWAVASIQDGGPVKAVLVYLDGRPAATAQLDLAGGGCSHYGCFPGTEWSATVPADRMTPGTHFLSVASADFQNRWYTLYQGEVQGLAAPTASAGAASR